MWFAIVGVMSPFILFSIKGTEISKVHKACGIAILFFLYFLGLFFF